MASESLNAPPISGTRSTWAEINLDNLVHNYRLVQQRVGPEVNVMAMLKADAYGHGAVRCAQSLSNAGAQWFGVALPEEAIELRNAGITEPILCVGGFWDGQQKLCLNHNITPVVYRLDMIESLNRAAAEINTVADVHIKIDTGMGRLGIRWDQLNEFVSQLSRFPNVRIYGLMTHFAAADDNSCQPLTRDQIDRFNESVKLFQEHGHHPKYLHLANSAGIFAYRESWGNMVRPGGVLYGLWRDVLSITVAEAHFRPVMSLYSTIELLKRVPPGETIGYGCTFEASRNSLIASLPIGYHDGYMRGLSNRANVIVRGKFAPVVGRISMDVTLVDVTDVPEVALGDVVTFLGAARDSSLEIHGEDLARIAGTLSYEVTCGISNRVPRFYISGSTNEQTEGKVGSAAIEAA
ncbi:MAG TPA: alanine racemase [Pyrinomonadaceae bacterium]|nr:alanine racemase [Pyrinomonadaceae bacterium]